MSFKTNTLHSVGKLLMKYVYKNPKKNLPKLINVAQKAVGKQFPTNWDSVRDVVTNPNNTWHDALYRALNDVDEQFATKLLLTFAIDAGLNGTKTLRTNREKYQCNIPWIILMDPTSACNLKCKGCWAAEYGNKSNLTLDEMRRIINQAKALGTHFFMFTGGEPLVKKDEVLTLAKENQDCIFLCFTNGTLIDDKFCKQVKQNGNLAFALSVEGSEETTDSRRGDGVYKKVLAAMQLLKKHKLIFGASVCYTSVNAEAVTSDAFYDMLIENGCLYSLYFHYMPVGSDSDTALLLTPDQRELVYRTIRNNRKQNGGKSIFVMDFQNDGEFVGGCIAGGRNYFHINSEGDAEPCVFIHYSDANIRQKSVLECLKSPLFKQYYKGQPFNDNMLRPCPMLENPQALRDIINKTGAKSTNLTCPESAEQLCSKCDEYAKVWAPRAKQIWEEQERFHPFTQYYRDTPEGKAELNK